MRVRCRPVVSDDRTVEVTSAIIHVMRLLLCGQQVQFLGIFVWNRYAVGCYTLSYSDPANDSDYISAVVI